MQGLLYSIVAILGAARTAQACITAHTYMQNCAVEIDDTVTVQLWDNGVKVCSGSDGKPGASSSTVFKFDCSNGGYVEVSDNSRAIHYHGPDGYDTRLAPSHKHNRSYVCGNVNDDIEIRGTQYESVFGESRCRGDKCPDAQLCDYRSSCDFDAKCG